MGYRFQTTRWSLVLLAGQSGTRESREALAHLLEAYWYPVYSFVRGQGHNEEDARDLTQGYFLIALEKNYLDDVRRDLGSFRGFLRASVKHFLSKERDRARTAKRGGDRWFKSLDLTNAEERYAADLGGTSTSPDTQFDRRWAHTVLGRAMTRLEREFADAGNAEQFRGLRAHLNGEGRAAPYNELAQRLDSSVGAIRVAVHRSRRRYGELLRAEIAETVAGPEAIDDEVRYLLQILDDA